MRRKEGQEGSSPAAREASLSWLVSKAMWWPSKEGPGGPKLDPADGDPPAPVKGPDEQLSAPAPRPGDPAELHAAESLGRVSPFQVRLMSEIQSLASWLKAPLMAQRMTWQACSLSTSPQRRECSVVKKLAALLNATAHLPAHGTWVRAAQLHLLPVSSSHLGGSKARHVFAACRCLCSAPHNEIKIWPSGPGKLQKGGEGI